MLENSKKFSKSNIINNLWDLKGQCSKKFRITIVDKNVTNQKFNKNVSTYYREL